MSHVELRSFHGVLGEVDTMASDAAAIDLFCMLCFFVEPKVVVEAGTYQGHLALAVANILRSNGTGTLYTADTCDDGFSVALSMECMNLIRPHIQFHHGDFLEMLKKVEDPIDLAYIDASSKENPHMRWEHYRAALKQLRPGGLVLVDDTAGDWSDAKDFQYVANIQLMQRRGLTLIQKPYA
jgi:predicted O-methyltransferase YrrM